jgi:hypothetical protein
MATQERSPAQQLAATMLNERLAGRKPSISALWKTLPLLLTLFKLSG